MKYRYECYRLAETIIDGVVNTELISLTDYFVQPFFYNGNLNQTLNVGEVILDGISSTTKNDFPPKTKLLVKRFEKQGNDYVLVQNYDLIVDNDNCEVYVGTPDYCCHKISCISPAAVAQGVHVDNIALTYKLDDVDLDYRVNTALSVVETSSIIEIYGENSPYAQNDTISVPSNTNYDTKEKGLSYIEYIKTYYYQNNYKYVWEDLEALKNLVTVVTAYQYIQIPFPKLFVYWGDNWQYRAQLNVSVMVTKIKRDKNGTKLSEITIYTDSDNALDWSQMGGEGAFENNNNLFLRRIANNTHTDYDAGIVSTLQPKQFVEMETIENNPVVAMRGTTGSTSPIIRFNRNMPSSDEISNGDFYEYKIRCLPLRRTGFLRNSRSISRCSTTEYATTNTRSLNQATTSVFSLVDVGDIDISIYSGESNILMDGGVLLNSGVPYNTYSFFQKAMQTTDTYILKDGEVLSDLDEKYPIVVNTDWKSRMLRTTMFETILETKNLWEVFQQIGKYLHAEPDLRFHRSMHGVLTGKFELYFKELGVKTESEKKSQVLSIFNSQAINQYFNTYDSYVSNLYSPENIVTEVLVPTSTDGSKIVNNDNAIFKFKYNVYELEEIYLKYSNQNDDWNDIKSYVFEKNIFNILTTLPNTFPSKANSLYWTINGDTLNNLQYKPQKDSYYSEPLEAFKVIVMRVYSLSESAVQDLKYNDIQILVKYRTQDSVRFTQFRPDMYDFVKNSPYENYPHHEQYYNQIDKIPDSERFSTNMWGQLIRNGNKTYVCNEFFIPHIDNANEKREGDLFSIDGKPYYVTATENEYYNDCILQKITYSMNWNEVAAITSMNSENRVYEVSERSQVRREIRINEFILFTKFGYSYGRILTPTSSRFLTEWINLIRKLVFNDTTVSVSLPNYALTTFYNDDDDRLFPSSEVERLDENTVLPKKATRTSKNILPVLNFPKKDGILFEWDMEDNFQAGEYIVEGDYGDEAAYNIIQSARYCDVSGKADKFQFNLFYLDPTTLTKEQSQTIILAKNDIETSVSFANVNSQNYIALNKDNREALSFNYQINLIYDEFITFNSLFAPKVDANNKLRLMLYEQYVGLFDQFLDFDETKVQELTEDTEGVVSGGYYLNNSFNAELEITVLLSQANIDTKKNYSLIWYENKVDSSGNIITDSNDNPIRIIYIAKNLTADELTKNTLTYYMYPTYNSQA